MGRQRQYIAKNQNAGGCSETIKVGIRRREQHQVRAGIEMGNGEGRSCVCVMLEHLAALADCLGVKGIDGFVGAEVEVHRDGAAPKHSRGVITLIGELALVKVVVKHEFAPGTAAIQLGQPKGGMHDPVHGCCVYGTVGEFLPTAGVCADSAWQLEGETVHINSSLSHWVAGPLSWTHLSPPGCLYAPPTATASKAFLYLPRVGQVRSAEVGE